MAISNTLITSHTERYDSFISVIFLIDVTQKTAKHYLFNMNMELIPGLCHKFQKITHRLTLYNSTPGVNGKYFIQIKKTLSVLCI